MGHCVPDCTKKNCGSNGCGNECGTCPPLAGCVGGLCECVPRCASEGRMCGSDGCGGTCGTCAAGTVCTDDASGAVTPTYQCIDQSVGCSDGSREGFTSVSTYPNIAACKGIAATQSLRTTRTGAWCGDQLGGCPVPEDACSPGWHLCMREGWPGDIVDRLGNLADCRSPNAGAGAFAAGASTSFDCGVFCCSYAPLPMECGNRGPVCCGQGCSGDCADLLGKNATGFIDAHCNAASGYDGVLCCKDPPVVGH
jgi:hypothetical protein